MGRLYGVDIEYLSSYEINKIKNFGEFIDGKSGTISKNNCIRVLKNLKNKEKVVFINYDYYIDNIYDIRYDVFDLSRIVNYLLTILDYDEEIYLKLFYDIDVETGEDLGFVHHVSMVKDIPSVDFNNDNEIFEKFFNKYNVDAIDVIYRDILNKEHSINFMIDIGITEWYTIVDFENNKNVKKNIDKRDNIMKNTNYIEMYGDEKYE